MRLFVIVISLIFISIIISGCLGGDAQCMNTTLTITDGGAYDIDKAYVKASDGNSYLITLYTLSRSPLRPSHTYEVQTCKFKSYNEITKVYKEKI
jgi:hypothetical protein